MGDTISIVMPIFVLVAIGLAVAWAGLLGPATTDALSDFVFVVAIPVLVFRIVATADLGGISAWRLFAAFFAAFAVTWAVGTILTRRLFARDARAGLVAGLAAGYGNTTMIGIPLASAAFGPAGTVPVALIIAVQLPVMMTAVALLMVRAERQDGVDPDSPQPATALKSVMENLVANPTVVAIALGAVWRLTGLPLTGVAGDIVGRIADLAGTLALFAMGMSLRKYGIRGNIAAGLVLSALKVVFMPALTLGFALAIGLPALETQVVVLAAACSTGVTPFVVAGRFRTGVGLASTTISLSTACAAVSIILWLQLVQSL